MMDEKRTRPSLLLSRRSLLAGAASMPSLGTTSLFGQTTPVWAAWRDLLNLRPDAAVLGAARTAAGLPSVSFSVQRIEDAPATKVNFDRYAVNVTRLPPNYTAATLFASMRQNLNDFLDHKLSTVSGIDEKDSSKWGGAGAAPLGSIMVFKIPKGPFWEEGAVVTSVVSMDRWIFTPVKIGLACPGEHPVSGNREFGYREAAGGVHQFYTRAADRATGICLGFGEDVIYTGADALWKSWQSKLIAFVASKNGAAQVVEPVSYKPTWVEVEKSGLFKK